MSYLNDWETVMKDLMLLPILTKEDIEDIKSNYNISLSSICDEFEKNNGIIDLKFSLNSILMHFIEPYVILRSVTRKNQKIKALDVLVNNRKDLEFLLKGIYNQCLNLRSQDKAYIKYQEIIQSSISRIEFVFEGVTTNVNYYNYLPYSKLIQSWLKSFLKLENFDFVGFYKHKEINIFNSDTLIKPYVEKNLLEEKVNTDEINLPEVGARYYAIYHAIKISIGKNNPFHATEKGYDKNLIVQYASDYYKVNKWKPIAFYNEFVQIDILNLHKIISPYKDWKRIVKSIAKAMNDKDVINYVNHYNK